MNPIGNNSVPFDPQEGPTAARWVPTTTGVLIAAHARLYGSGNFIMNYGRMDLIGGSLETVMVGFSAGGMLPGGPNQLALNLSGQTTDRPLYSQFAIA